MAGLLKPVEFGKIGKDQSAFFKERPPTTQQFTFKTAAFDGLDFTSETKVGGDTSGNGVTNKGSFKLSDPSGMDVSYRYNYLPIGEMVCGFESNFDVAKLAGFDGLKVTLSGSNDDEKKAKGAAPLASVTGTLGYEVDQMVFGLSGGVEKQTVKFSGDAATVVSGVQVGLSTGLESGIADIYEKLTLKAAYGKDLFGVALDLSRKNVDLRASYVATPLFTVAGQLTYAAGEGTGGWSAGNPSGAFCSKLKITEAATLSAILSAEQQKNSWKPKVEFGFEQKLRDGCDLKLGLAAAPLGQRVMEGIQFGFSLSTDA